MKSLIPILISILLASGLIGCSIDVQQTPVTLCRTECFEHGNFCSHDQRDRDKY